MGKTALSLILIFSFPLIAAASTVTFNARDLAPHTNISFSPASGTFTEGSTFQVPIFLNTEGNSVNAVELHIVFDASKLAVVQPSGGNSIIGVWVEPPSYNNTQGTATIIGTLPKGIVTDSGLIVTVTFQAKVSGTATVSLADTSRVLLNDGLGSETIMNSNRGQYTTVVPHAPGDVQIYSDTHPFQDQWYNNNSPALAWQSDPGTTGFSYLLDNKPTTVPPTTVTTTDTVKQYPNLSDGIWYFHIRALKRGVWGGTSTYTIHIDLTQPAVFTPTVDYLGAAVIKRFLVSFFTTDALSGIDHYEVGVIDTTAPATESPVFVRTDSPYQVPYSVAGHGRVIVRAFDRAGNIREVQANVQPALPIFAFLMANAVPILIGLIILMLLSAAAHYLFAHRIITRIEKGFELLKADEPRRSIRYHRSRHSRT